MDILLRSSFILMLAGGMLCSTTAMANRGPVFSVYDADKDGYLSQQEFNRLEEKLIRHHRLRKRPCPVLIDFSEFDKNQDGKISEDELVDGLNKERQKRRRMRFRGGREN